MKGMSIEGMRKHPSLIPLFGIIAIGCGIAAGYVIRLAVRSPDVSWNKRENEPWQYYSNKRYKLYDAGHDDHEAGTQAPKF